MLSKTQQCSAKLSRAKVTSVGPTPRTARATLIAVKKNLDFCACSLRPSSVCSWRSNSKNLLTKKKRNGFAGSCHSWRADRSRTPSTIAVVLMLSLSNQMTRVVTKQLFSLVAVKIAYVTSRSKGDRRGQRRHNDDFLSPLPYELSSHLWKGPVRF